MNLVKQKLLDEQKVAVNEQNDLGAYETAPKKKLYDVVCNIIIKYQDVFNLQRLARIINLKKIKQIKEKERLAEKNFHGGGSFKQQSYKFFSSNIKHKTKSDNVSFGSKNSFKFFSNSQKLKTKSDSKLENGIVSGRRHTQIEGLGLRGSILSDFKQFLEIENKKKEDKVKNIELQNKGTKKIESAPVGVVNGRMMDFLSSELQNLNDYEKKITHIPIKGKKAFRFIL